MARAHRIRAADLLELGAVDEVVPELPDASGEPEQFCRRITAALCDQLAPLLDLPPQERLAARHQRYRSLV